MCTSVSECVCLHNIGECMEAMRTWFHFISFENMKKPHKFIRCELYYINALNRNLLPDTYLYGIRMLYPTKRYNYTPRKNP